MAFVFTAKIGRGSLQGAGTVADAVVLPNTVDVRRICPNGSGWVVHIAGGV